MSAAWSSRLGRIGAWFHPGYGDEARTEFAVEAETLGYPVAWLGFGPASVADLAAVEQILRATSTIVVATAIVNMWTNDAEEVAASYRRITSRYGDRVLLGVGIGHPEANSELPPALCHHGRLPRPPRCRRRPRRSADSGRTRPPSTSAGRRPNAGKPPLSRGSRSHARSPPDARAGCRDRTRADSCHGS